LTVPAARRQRGNYAPDAGLSFSSLSIDTGTGNDRVHGLALDRDLHIESPQGHEQLTIENSAMRSLSGHMKFDDIKGGVDPVDRQVRPDLDEPSAC
jgi:hypothetical protein